jgi:hypothetical protein
MSKKALFFAGVKVTEGDPEGTFLRVSCYKDGPGSHARFSVWIDDEARCVISIPESEALDLARFIEQELGHLREREAVVPFA